MRAFHLKQVGNIWYYQRRRPKEYADIEKRSLIRFSLKTRNFNEAKVLATQQSIELENQWAKAKERGISINSDNSMKRFSAATQVTSELKLDYNPSNEITDIELLTRLRMLILGDHNIGDQKAVLGLVEKPLISLTQAFECFWDHIQDEWMNLSHDQR